jgi:hypothetical protein
MQGNILLLLFPLVLSNLTVPMGMHGNELLHNNIV